MSDEQEIDGMIDFSGAPRSLGEQRDYGFQIMKARMMEVIAKQIAHTPKLMQKTALEWYGRGCDDAFKVFAQVVETNTDEELSPG